MASVNGYGAYSQTQGVWNQNAKSTKVDTKNSSSKVSNDAKSATDNVKTSEWKPIDTKSVLVPTKREDIGMAVGDVQLSDKAKDYYKSLKAKFGNMEFIAVSKDMMSQVKANAAAYGNANKTVVLIDEEKLERMATDESFRKKYEGIIAMAQTQMSAARNSLASSGANIKNFGMQVNEDGSTSFFATLEKSSDAQAKRIEKKQAEKKAAKAAEKKAHDKKVKEERLEKAKEEKKSEKTEGEDKEYFKIEADSIEDLINKVSKFAYDNAASSVMADAEKGLGQNIDFEG